MALIVCEWQRWWPVKARIQAQLCLGDTTKAIKSPVPDHLPTVPGVDSDDELNMPEKVLETPYPVIDTDPHFSRVLRYMRTEDYTAWAVVTGGFPAAWRLWGTSSLPTFSRC